MPEICSIFLHTLPEIFIRDGIAAGNEAGRDWSLTKFQSLVIINN